MKPETFEITEFDVNAEQAGPRLRVAFMSDLHVGRYTPMSTIEAALTACEAQRPDAVLLGGDYLSGEYDEPYIKPLAETLARLRPPLGTFYVLGNHDYWTGAEKVLSAFEGVGFKNIINRNVRLSDGLSLCGIDDIWMGQPDIDAAFAGTVAGHRLVLSHNPKIFPRIREQNCVAICGHTHGGQIRIPLVPNPALLTGKYPYIKGWFYEGNSQLYVNRGIGRVILPVRINCRPEITVLQMPAS